MDSTLKHILHGGELNISCCISVQLAALEKIWSRAERRDVKDEKEQSSRGWLMFLGVAVAVVMFVIGMLVGNTGKSELRDRLAAIPILVEAGQQEMLSQIYAVEIFTVYDGPVTVYRLGETYVIYQEGVKTTILYYPATARVSFDKNKMPQIITTNSLGVNPR